MNVSELRESKFLRKEDVGAGALLTIREVYEENIAKDGAPAEMKWCVAFDEVEKPMVLNSTNGQLIAKVTGSEESDAWVGHKVVLFHDPSISFSGKVVGGIRVRAPRGAAAAKPGPIAAKVIEVAKPAAPQEPDDETIPF